MKMTITFGIVPNDLVISEPYHMICNSSDLQTVARIVNQGIDSHLDAVFTQQSGNQIWINDSKSMRCFLRRCFESNDSNAVDLASCIMQTLGYDLV
jgi:hypothetical protein